MTDKYLNDTVVKKECSFLTWVSLEIKRKIVTLFKISAFFTDWNIFKFFGLVDEKFKPISYSNKYLFKKRFAVDLLILQGIFNIFKTDILIPILVYFDDFFLFYKNYKRVLIYSKKVKIKKTNFKKTFERCKADLDILSK